MQRREIEALCAAIVPGKGGIEIHDLSRGLVNEAYRVTRAGRAYSLRLPLIDGVIIALNRAWEVQALQAAGAAGVAPALRFQDAAHGILLSDWLVGDSWAGLDAAGGARIEQVADLLSRVHALTIPQPAHRMTPRDWIIHYESVATPGVATPGALARRSEASRYLKQWDALPAVAAVVCHGDLHVLNLVQSGDSLRLLDWEYAHASDAFWDLAGWCANNDLGEHARRRLLARYLSAAPTTDDWRRLQLLAWLYDYVCLQWSALYLNLQGAGAASAAIAARAALLDARLSIPAN
jgi:thiamine kinase